MAETIDRRALLASGIGFAGMTALDTMAGGSRVLAAAPKPLVFQLSWIKSIQYGGYFAGIDQGIYKKFGIEPTFNSGGPTIDAIANVASGKAGLGDRPIGPLVVARDKGIPIKVIGTVFQKSPQSILSLAKKPVKTVKELKGKTVAVSVSSRPLLLNLLRDAGVDAKSVNIVPSSPDPAALVSGQIDVYVGYSTNQGVMLQTRGVDLHILNVHDLGVPETAGTLYGREDFLQANRDLVVAFLRASREAWGWALEHPDETARFMVEKYGNPGLDFKAQSTEIKASKPFIMTGAATSQGLLALDVALFDRIIDVYRKVNIVKSGMKGSDLCDPSFIEAAIKA